MGNLSRQASLSAGELADLRFTEAAVSADERYPDGAIFIGIDEPHFSDVLAEAVAKSQPLVIVYPDGRELIGEPRDGKLAVAEAPPTKQVVPVRIQLLEILSERTASDLELAREVNANLGVVFYHLKSLRKIGLIDLVETRQSRGATVHLYRLSDQGGTGNRGPDR